MIKLYGASWCGPCIETKKFFDDNNVDYEFVDMDNKNLPQEIVDKHINTIPFIEIYDDNNNIVFTHTGVVETERHLKYILNHGQ